METKCACEKCQFCIVEKIEIRKPVPFPKPRTFLGIPIEMPIYEPAVIMAHVFGGEPTGKFRKEFWCVAMPEKVQVTDRKETCMYFKEKQNESRTI
jgi:hypothetical protein